MFAQLHNAGVLEKISGLILGRFTDCLPSVPSKPHLTVEQVLQDVSQRVKCPVISNFQYGHIPKKLTVPLGLKAKMDSAKGLIEVEEAGVV